MKKININNFKYRKEINNYLYVVEINNDEYKIKRIETLNNSKNIDYITIIDNEADIKKYVYSNNSKININLNINDKNTIIEDILIILNNDNIIKDVIDLEKLNKVLKNNYINYIISDGNIGLSLTNNKNNLNIILTDNNKIIGKILLDDFDMYVDDYYFEDSLKLLKKYLCLFKEEKYNKILSLIK